MDKNQDLQATHQILKIFEIAKAHGDQILDHIPGLYVLFSPDGEIHRGNLQLAKELNVEFESLHLIDLSELMLNEQWSEFKKRIDEAMFEGEAIEFEMDFTSAGKVSKTYLCNLRPSRIDRSIDKYVLTLLGQEITQVKAAAVELGRMQGELNTAKEVQDLLFISDSFEDKRCSIAASYISASECGGDFWYYNQVGDKMFIWIGDVTGHGVAAALVTAAARATLSLIDQDLNMTPAKALVQLNRAVLSISRGKKLMSFFVASVDLKSGHCEFANAGHPSPFHVHTSETESHINFITLGSSPLLGMMNQPNIDVGSFILNSGDMIFAYTDGVTEIINDREMVFGDRRLFKAITDAQKASSELKDMRTSIAKNLAEFKGEAPLPDDQSFLIFKRK